MFNPDPSVGQHYLWRASLVIQQYKNLPANAGDASSIPVSERSPKEGHGNPLQENLPGESHGQRSLVGYSPWGYKQLDSTERLNSIICGSRGGLLLIQLKRHHLWEPLL